MSGIYSRYKRFSTAYELPFPSPVDPHAHRALGSGWFSRRYTKRYAVLIALLITCTFLRFWTAEDSTSDLRGLVVDDALPPLYGEWHQEELQLPQHNPDLPFPEGREGRYINIANHVYGLGWGNALQEILLDSYIAYKSGRAYVFDNYTWSRDLDPAPYSEYNGKLIPSRVPLRTMITGPTAGGPYPEGDHAPRSVGVDYFKEVCKNPKIISANEVNANLGQDPTAKMTLNHWVDTLNAIDNRCVEVDRFSDQIFGYWTFGSSQRLLDIWPEYKKSPIVRNFRWSPLVQDAFDKNARLFTSPSTLGSFFSTFRAPKSDPYMPIPGLLVLHVRRGDYEEHCLHMSKWASQYTGFNAFPEFLDQFKPPPGSGGGNATVEAKAIYTEHCFPSIEQIVKRTEEIRESSAGKGLKNVYVMTNGPRPWVAELKAALKTTGHWSKIATSRDLKLTPEQKYISQAIDMLIGHRAQVLLGNGFSSMTANIVMLRMARSDLRPESNRFW